jgi:LmbE family N-acetylglucosaminyl deacetylase
MSTILAAKAAHLLNHLCAASAATPVPMTAIIAAHPDDEVIGAGSRLPRLREAVLVHVTDGSPRDLGDARACGFATREEYGAARRRELLAALALAGLRPEQTLELGCVDQEASLHLVDLSRRTAALLRELKPEMVLTHPYEGGHPDHDATVFIVHAACELLRRQGLPAPVLVEMTSYHNSPQGIRPGEFLENGDGVRSVALSEAECDLKRQMFECYPTQRNTLGLFPIGIERFRPAPRYGFTRPPHEGQLFYESFPWGMSGDRFRTLAGEALGRLEIRHS